jgi:transglutaminase-like putative cysteine protease
MNEYLQSTHLIDWQHPEILALAQRLRAETPLETARRCYEWVRDEIRHSYDYHLNPVTSRASEVLEARTGYCYAKSHLLAALLRANDIPAGLCYQRLEAYEPGTYSLHGLNAVYLPETGWYRIDARGNKPGVDAQFIPPVEQLAFNVGLPGEYDFEPILSEPLPNVVAALQAAKDWEDVSLNLPDVKSPAEFEAFLSKI